MKQQQKLQTTVISALLCAIGIIIPMFAPKIVIGPASFTLASHVAVFIAMFISPTVAIAVALVTGVGFLMSGFPIIIVLRALTHVIFAGIGAYLLKKNGSIMRSLKSTIPFALFIAVIHAFCEVVVVTFFYWGGSSMTSALYEQGYILAVMVPIGIGTIIHSMIDFAIAIFVWKPLQHVLTIPASVRISKK